MATVRRGRPSKYTPAYVEEVVTFCAQGYSLTAFAGEIGVDRATISRWMDEHAEFRVAASRAKAKRAQFWEQQAIDLAQNGGQGGRATMVIFALKNHAPEDFQEIKKHEVSGKDGAPLVSVEERRAKARELIEAAFGGHPRAAESDHDKITIFHGEDQSGASAPVKREESILKPATAEPPRLVPRIPPALG